MLAWYGHAEPDIVGEFEEANNVKFVPKYYTGGDNMLGLIAQSPRGTFDVILSDGEYVQQLNAAGYIEELDPADYPFDDFFPEFQKFPGHWQDDKLLFRNHAIWIPRRPLTIRRPSPKKRPPATTFLQTSVLPGSSVILTGICPTSAR